MKPLVRKLTMTVIMALAMPVLAAPAISVGDKDMVKDVDIFNDTVTNERAQVITDDLKTDGPKPKVEVIIDSSGSMDQILAKNKSKMYFLKELMKPFFRASWKEKKQHGASLIRGKTQGSVR